MMTMGAVTRKKADRPASAGKKRRFIAVILS